MGQGASTPQDGMETSATRRSGTQQQQQQQQNGGVQSSQDPTAQNMTGNSINSGVSDEAATAVLRRSRRLRSHIEHLSRIGNRIMSPGSSTSMGNRMRFRSRSSRFSNSRSPSPTSLGGSSRTRPSSPRTRLRNVPRSSHIPESDLGDMMDISPVTTATPQPQSPSFASPTEPTSSTESRPSRMSRVRSSLSISSWPNILPDIRAGSSARPSSGRPSQSRSRRASMFGSAFSDHGHGGDIDIDMPSAPDINSASQSGPSQSGTSQSRQARPASGTGTLMDELDNNPARVRPGEDQAAMLSRLLSVAAAATAASLVGGTEQAIREAEDVAGDNGGDGSFESFLRALQNGRLAAALRNGGNELGGGTPPDGERAESVMPPLNFFRMFRFGSNANSNTDHGRDEGSDGSRSRMVPVIIVGIRSVTPRDTAEAEGNRPAPFFDALANLPVNIPSIHRRPRLSNSHRRASMGGPPGGSVGFDNQRHTRGASVGSLRPTSELDTSPIPPSLSESSSGALPPPSTPADPSMSNFRQEPLVPESRVPVEPAESNTLSDDNGVGYGSGREPSRRRLSRRLSSPEALPPHGRSAGSSNASSGSSTNGGSGSSSSSRRPSGSPEGTRSWIIYVLGGSYPEDHPILTTPSLFTDAPTYEDMMLLSSLLGPAKPPVATRDDVNSAGGIFTFGDGGALGAEVAEGDRCLICLGDYEDGEQCRQLTKCQHVFHKDCIDEWLTTGRNSCPLCRGQGVNEKEQSDPTPPPAASDPLTQDTLGAAVAS
ncbi:hypothetical protein L873DRAFT_1711153 [Choiromyces venosus 120613-1]|uniref:RING-type domain-containing protein n=1 Tax=Choiromyces venosus 120613-1 TaxID=1336337 RepID=A0A3N4J1H2_9PEZI|nr:hypothetical protein L873DRAFT_1711153 [Choiromyces venosus 120613-1]